MEKFLRLIKCWQYLAILLFGLLATTAAAQSKQKLSGTVVDAAGKPIPGVTVIWDSGRNGTTTDTQGAYQIRVSPPPGSEIEFSFIGMDTQKTKVPANGILNITLKSSTMAVDEVIVTGYGTYKKAAYAGSASVVNTAVMADTPHTSVNNMLQGMAAGVTSSMGTSGQPGAASSVRIRGTGSYNASNEPLYVIDGVPVLSGDIGSLGTSGTDIMATLNPSDIENISIIKDAAAASLYGSRAANGVIIITTKQGRPGKAKFTLKSDWGFSEFAVPFRPYLDGDERNQFLYDAMKRQYTYLKSDKKTADFTTAEAYADATIKKFAKPESGWANWWDALFRDGFYQNYEVSASGGTEKVSYFSSLSYRDQEGIQRTQDMNTVQGRLNVRYKATKRLELGANVMFSKMTQNVGYDGMEYNAPLYGLLHKITSLDPIYNADGTYNRSLRSNSKYNPVAIQDNDTKKQDITRAFNILYGTYSFTDDLKFTTRFSYDYTINKAVDWSDPNGSSDWTENGNLYKKMQEFTRTSWQNQLAFVRTFGEKHNVDALIGYEMEDTYQDYLSGSGINFVNSEKHEPSSAAVPTGFGGNSARSRLVSYLAKLNYNFDNKYFIGGSYRMDGTSRLRRENRWGNFWSVSGAWRFMEESFLEGARGVLSEGKLRMSYGVNGTQPSGYYAGYNTYSYNAGYNGMPGQIETTPVSETLRWESNYNFNVGLDLTFIDRINVTAEFYNRTTKDLLFNAPVSSVTGVSSLLDNIGSFQNRGIEFEIMSRNMMRKNFSWTTSLNLSRNWNKVLKLNGDPEMTNGRFIIKEGYDFWTTNLVEFADINPENGMARFYVNKVKEDGTIDRSLTEDYDEAQKVLGVSTSPKLVGGLTNSLRYRWFDFSFTMTFSLGGYSYDNASQKSRTAGAGSAAANNQIPEYYRDCWKQPGDVAKYESWIYLNTNKSMTSSSSAQLHSTDHLRLKSFTFGATLPEKWTSKAGMSKVRAYVSGVNMLTWASWDQYDPEVPVGGSISYNTPPMKTITFGIEIGF